MTVLDPYNLLPQGFGLMAWNADIANLKQAGELISASGMQLEVTSVSDVLNFSTGQYQRVHVKLVEVQS